MTSTKGAVSENADSSSLKSSTSASSSNPRTKPVPLTLKRGLKLLAILVVYILVNLLGGYIFLTIEKKPTEGQPHWLPQFKQEFLNNHSSCLTHGELEKFLSALEEIVNNDSVSISGSNITYPEVWTLNSGFVLAFTIASTIGYGLVTPVTTGGQLFAVFFALMSIPFTGILAAKIGSIMAYYIKKASTNLMGWVAKAKVIGLMCTLLFGLLIYVILPSILLTFISNEEGWTFTNCFYCVIITLTTIGFGDFVPDPSSEGGILTSIFVLIWVIAGLAWFATIIQLIATQLSKQAKTLQNKVAITSPPLMSRFNHTGKEEEKSGEEVAGLHNTAVLVKMSDMSNYKPIEEDATKREKLSFPSQQVLTKEDNKIEGPGSFHAVAMSHLQSENEKLSKNDEPHKSLETEKSHT